MISNILLIAVGFALLMLGAQWLVDGASSIARKYHIPEIIIRTYNCINWNIYARTCC